MRGAPAGLTALSYDPSGLPTVLRNRRSNSGILIRRAAAVACLHECEAVDDYTARTTNRCRQGSRKDLPFVFVRIVHLHSSHVAGSVSATEDVELAVESNAGCHLNGGWRVD